MNGLLFVSLDRAGTLLYHHVATSNFGLPAEGADAPFACIDCRCGQRHVDPLQLGALLFALHSFATGAVAEAEGSSKEAEDGVRDAEEPLSLLDTGGVRLHFRATRLAGPQLLTVVITSTAVTADSGQQLARTFTAAFLERYRSKLETRGGRAGYRGFSKLLPDLLRRSATHFAQQLAVALDASWLLATSDSAVLDAVSGAGTRSAVLAASSGSSGGGGGGGCLPWLKSRARESDSDTARLLSLAGLPSLLALHSDGSCMDDKVVVASLKLLRACAACLPDGKGEWSSIAVGAGRLQAKRDAEWLLLWEGQPLQEAMRADIAVVMGLLRALASLGGPASEARR
eukprot:PLAT2919.1.p1 GENE.PLAT2919.1~~PLAT2919.1.p1  ORF type:complete len:343 (+),score=122.99 PLAT2919.1:83-1111(+)